MFHRRPAAMDQLSSGASISLARLAGLEGFSRSVLVAVVPIVALQALGTKEAVSHVYLAASIFTLMITLNISRLEKLLARRRVVTLGGIFLVCAALFLYGAGGPMIAMGVGMRSAAASIFSVCMSLYIMDYIGKRELTRNESRRMVYSGMAWLIGPAAGFWLWSNLDPAFTFALSSMSAISMLAYFWYLRLGDDAVVSAARSHPGSPLKAVARFVKQQRLRIAYGITLSRSCFWVTLFIFGPIYVVEAGMPTWVAGILLSVISALLFLSPIVRLLSERYGTRQMIVGGLSLTGASLLVLAFIGAAKPIGLLFWLTGALGGVTLDTLGNIPFMRLVRPRDRSEMTMVFSTWREGSELLTPAIAAVVLVIAPFWMLYVVIALMHFGSVAAALKLPRRL